MGDEGPHRQYFPEHSTRYIYGFPDHFEHSSSYLQDPQPNILRKSAKWDPPVHKIFISTCEIVVAEGHRQGKCFSTKGWQHLCELFNRSVGKNWTITQLKNYWTKLRMEHKYLFELLRCTGIEYHSGTGTIVAPEHWWEAKIKENRKYAKYKNRDCSEIYDTYSKLFGDTGDSTKYALSLTKLSRRGFDLGTDSDENGGGDKFPINAEGTDSSNSPIDDRGHSSMNITGRHSGDESKFKAGKEKGKKKKYDAREVSASPEHMISVGTDLASIARSNKNADMSIDECMNELLSFGHVEEGSPLYLFALWFLRVRENRNSFRAAKTPYFRFKFIEYCFDRDNQSNPRKN